MRENYQTYPDLYHSWNFSNLKTDFRWIQFANTLHLLPCDQIAFVYELSMEQITRIHNNEIPHVGLDLPNKIHSKEANLVSAAAVVTGQ